MNTEKQTLELFSGTESFSKYAKKQGYKTFTIDNNPLFNPDLCINILDIRTSQLPDEIYMLWASPPCTCYSVASIGSSWIGNYHPKRVETALAMAYVLETLAIIKYFKPKYWFIENPRGVLRKMGFMEGLHRKTITYCQYGDNRMKPTDMWTNFIEWNPKPMCHNGDNCHESAPRGSRTGTQGLKNNIERSRIPEGLFKEIFEQIQKQEKTDKFINL